MFRSKSTLKIILFLAVSFLVLLYFYTRHTDNERLSLFPMENYNQNLSAWITPTDINYDKPLLTEAQQKTRKNEWMDHYFGSYSPWNAVYVNQIYAQPSPKNLASLEQEVIESYSNQNKPPEKIGYGSNFRPYENTWIKNINDTIQTPRWHEQHYDPAKRAIAIDNISGRNLPTHEVHFYSHTIAGEGYPFDNLQAAVVWAGTPLYILEETEDHAWAMVLTPNFIAWVESNKLARVDDNFIRAWNAQAKNNLVALTDIKIAVKDSENERYRFAGYLGMVFPGRKEKDKFTVFIPVSDEKQQAQIHHAEFSEQQATDMPLRATPRNFITIMGRVLGRPYGWGGMYFYNDCSAELKNLFATFGIWLPTHSSNQVNPDFFAVKKVDLSSNDLDTRLAYLTEKGHPFMSIVYIGGHVFLYLGNYANPHDPTHQKVALSYQNIWGLRPNNADKRLVIGNAVLLPILKTYPDNANVPSLAGKKYFQIGYLDENAPTPKKMDLHGLLYP